jgi:carbon storage regulator
MLVLSRRENERIKLGSSIVVTVVRVTGDKVRLGIEAPADVLVLREELDQAPPLASIESDVSSPLAERYRHRAGESLGRILKSRRGTSIGVCHGIRSGGNGSSLTAQADLCCQHDFAPQRFPYLPGE